MLFKDFSLHSKLLKAVEALKYVEPTPIQRDAIPEILAGRDVMASAQTGTGKTAAFVLPALERLLEPSTKSGKGPRILILAPTRELAMQVNQDIQALSKFCKFHFGSVLGGMPYPPQIRLLEKPVDLLVATPGRLMDHMKSKRVDFSRLEMLVLDEADRMLDLGFIHAVQYIAGECPSQRQTLLFSATLEGRVLDVAKFLLKDPVQIQLAVNSQRHDKILQLAYFTDTGSHKTDVLRHLLKGDEITQAVIFTATKRAADSLARLLKVQGHVCDALHGDMKQSLRQRTVERLKAGKIRLLVATDVAARGLDIKGMSHVINFELPSVAEDYIHRIGRTGRAGAEGVAISLVAPSDWSKFAEIQRLTNQKIERRSIPGLEAKCPEPKLNTVVKGSRTFRPSTMRRRGRPLGMGK